METEEIDAEGATLRTAMIKPKNKDHQHSNRRHAWR